MFEMVENWKGEAKERNSLERFHTWVLEYGSGAVVMKMWRVRCQQIGIDEKATRGQQDDKKRV